MPAPKPVQVEGNFVDHNGTKIEIPKPIEQMTQADWIAMASSPKSSLRKVTVNDQSFMGLHVVLKDKNYIPLWLYSGTRNSETPRAFDTLERAVQMGANLVSTLDDLDERSASRFSLGADGHIHRDDVVLAKMPIVAYYALQAQSIERSRRAIEYQSVESKAYDGVDVPKYVKGSRDVQTYEATTHTVEYKDRPTF